MRMQYLLTMIVILLSGCDAKRPDLELTDTQIKFSVEKTCEQNDQPLCYRAELALVDEAGDTVELPGHAFYLNDKKMDYAREKFLGLFHYQFYYFSDLVTVPDDTIWLTVKAADGKPEKLAYLTMPEAIDFDAVVVDDSAFPENDIKITVPNNNEDCQRVTIYRALTANQDADITQYVRQLNLYLLPGDQTVSVPKAFLLDHADYQVQRFDITMSCTKAGNIARHKVGSNSTATAQIKKTIFDKQLKKPDAAMLSENKPLNHI